jgi:hypothetical protein
MKNENMLKPFVKSYVHIPFLGAGIVFGLMLLFYRDLDSTIRTTLVPAIAVYMIGSSIIGYLYFELDVINCVRAAKNAESPSPQPSYITWIFRFLHGFWFLLLAIYLFCKNVL